MQDASPENKLRLLMIYACVYPEKFEGDKASKLMQVAAEFSLHLAYKKLYMKVTRIHTMALLVMNATLCLIA